MCAESDCQEPIHHWFGLTYSSYLVLPRSALQTMPVEFQRRFVAMLDEMQATIDPSVFPDSYAVNVRGEGGRFERDPYADYRRGPRVPLRQAAAECTEPGSMGSAPGASGS